jgi:hypothetical protein
MPRKRKIHLADPLDFDHEEDALAYADAADLPGGDVLLTPDDLAKRWRTTPAALRKKRERGTGPPFICMDRRHIRYRLLDIVNYEANRVAYSIPQARSIGLLCIAVLAATVLSQAARLGGERAAPQFSFGSYEAKPLRALSGPAGASSFAIAGDEAAVMDDDDNDGMKVSPQGQRRAA